ncbi:glycosyltransferase family 4 protein [Phaeovulum sp.]|uniref:glycosyltransferase family 4 protein n=1 Tax=Phaeovulum sp. TaxID=2934796 RepID=UPI00272F60E8|nr:MraY family glycosyltransferase [Phaeovulum sp.]MDP1670297.1 MraY family glycosyltransferase [Phaeovulum sp.]MDZ4120149.1 MraY family glycosyltransferase [Phaeovulum sp.]
MLFLTSAPAGVLFVVSFLICGALVATKRLHLHRSSRAHDGDAVQSAHTAPTPRVGGIGVVAAVLLAFIWIPPEPLRPTFGMLALSLLPIFFAGLAEDLGFGVSASRRLFAAMASATLAVLMLQIWVDRVDVPVVDHLFELAPLAIAFTVIASAGICNAFNLIDGLNGLAAATGILVALGLGGIALQAGDPGLANVAFALVPAILGFLVLNFPFGKIFLGDAGAYSMGHALVWTAIVVVARSAEVTPWAIMLVFFWPICDTLFAIYRRSRSGKQLGQPDQMHFHQLVMRGIEIAIVGRGRRHIANPLAAIALLFFIGIPVTAGVWLWDRPAAAAAAVFGFAAAFIGAYALGLRYFRKYARAHRKNRQVSKSEKRAKARVR